MKKNNSPYMGDLPCKMCCMYPPCEQTFKTVQLPLNHGGVHAMTMLIKKELLTNLLSDSIK